MPVYLFDEILFRPDIITGAAQGGPELANTTITNPATGVSKVNITRYDPRESWSLTLSLLNDDQRAYVNAFWRGGWGSGIGCRFRIPSDFKSTHEVIGTGDGTTTVFKLVKAYMRPGSIRENVRRIIKPVTPGLLDWDGATTRTMSDGTPLYIHIYVNGVLQTSGVTVDSTTGVVTFTTAPATGLVIDWSGEFDVPASFVGNSYNQKVDPGLSSEIQGLQIREILGPELGIT